MGAGIAPGEGVVVHHTQSHWDTVLLLVQALDVSIWLLQRVRRQHWPADLHTLGSCERNYQPM